MTENATEESGKKEGKWFERGFNQDKIEEEEAVEQERAMLARAPWRHRTPVGATSNVVFVDEDPITFKEHRLWLNNRMTTLTCRRGFGRCATCEQGDEPVYVGALTIIDLEPMDKFGNPAKTKKGVVIGPQKRLFIARSSTMKKLEKRRKKYGLAGQRYEIERSKDNSPAEGDDFEHEGEYDLSKLKTHDGKAMDVSVIDYELYLKPKSEDEMVGILRQIGFGEILPAQTGGSTSDEKIDF